MIAGIDKKKSACIFSLVRWFLNISPSPSGFIVTGNKISSHSINIITNTARLTRK